MKEAFGSSSSPKVPVRNRIVDNLGVSSEPVAPIIAFSVETRIAEESCEPKYIIIGTIINAMQDFSAVFIMWLIGRLCSSA